MLQVALGRQPGGWATADDVSQAFLDLRVPPPPQLTRELTRLTARGHVLRRNDSMLTLTPEGVEQVREFVGELDVAQLEPEIAALGGVVLGHGRHSLLPWTMAPVEWRPAISRLLEHHPFDHNVFCMTRFQRTERDDDPIGRVVERIRDVLTGNGLHLHLASDRFIDDDLWANIAGYMWACRYGIALFEDRVDEGLNYNLVIETGAMLATGRRCALLRDRTAPPMPTDFVGRIYRPVDFDDLDGVADEVDKWARVDLASLQDASPA
jgi:hypothetical protein